MIKEFLIKALYLTDLLETKAINVADRTFFQAGEGLSFLGLIKDIAADSAAVDALQGFAI